jgi:hypothetical protein
MPLVSVRPQCDTFLAICTCLDVLLVCGPDGTRKYPKVVPKVPKSTVTVCASVYSHCCLFVCSCAGTVGVDQKYLAQPYVHLLLDSVLPYMLPWLTLQTRPAVPRPETFWSSVVACLFAAGC